ncbi:hypothetical protein HAV15_004405 [Penicillium sp. str. |nr:hypothetical protein HAV15_004405 [Penicillium sp. str. \
MDGKSPKDGQPDSQPPQGIKIPCPVCKYRKFRSEQAFSDHIQDEHNIFACHKCDALYACRDDLARHKSEIHGKVNYKPKYKKKHKQKKKGKFRPVIRSVSMPASEDTSSTQLPTMQLRPQPAQPRPSTTHARQPSTETRKSPAQIRQSTMQPGQSSARVHQEDEQSHPAPAQVFRSPHRPVFHPQHQKPIKSLPAAFRRLLKPSNQQDGLLKSQWDSLKHLKSSNQWESLDPQQGFTSHLLNPIRHQPRPIKHILVAERTRYRSISPPLQVPELPEENHQSPQGLWNSQFLNQEPQHQQSQHEDHVFRAVDPPARDSNSSEQYSQSPIHDSQQAKEVSHFLQLGSQSLQNSHLLVQDSQYADIPRSLEDTKSPDRAIQQAEQVSQSFSRSSQSLELGPPLELSRLPLQVPQEAEKVTQSLQKPFQFLVCHYEQAKAISHPPQPSQSAVHISDQTEQSSNSSLQLSANDSIAAEANETDRATTSIPATNPTTPDLFIPPPPTDPTFSLVYGTMPHRWTDLEPLEQTLIIRSLLAKCHSRQLLYSQGYNAPRTINTKSCVNQGEPHQHHIDPRPTNPNSTHRKAIVLDCEMIETTVCTSELAFIAAIDFLTGEILINSYVTPTAPVTNWLTPVSGITQEKMDTAIAEGNVFVSNADARGALRKFLNRDTVLIGHALQHDLRTLSLIHGRIVDTSVITSEAVFRNVSSNMTLPRIWGLETLAEELIGIKTQGGDEGHDSLEDALTTREILIWCWRCPDCLKDWAEKTRDSLAHMRNRRGVRRNRGNEGGGANANDGQEERTAE